MGLPKVRQKRTEGRHPRGFAVYLNGRAQAGEINQGNKLPRSSAAG